MDKLCDVKVNFAVADGSLHVDNDDMEVQNIKLIHNEIVYALDRLVVGGDFVLKTFGCDRIETHRQMHMLKRNFKSVTPYKPKLSSRLGAESYLICRGYSLTTSNIDEHKSKVEIATIQFEVLKWRRDGLEWFLKVHGYDMSYESAMWNIYTGVDTRAVQQFLLKMKDKFSLKKFSLSALRKIRCKSTDANDADAVGAIRKLEDYCGVHDLNDIVNIVDVLLDFDATQDEDYECPADELFEDDLIFGEVKLRFLERPSAPKFSPNGATMTATVINTDECVKIEVCEDAVGEQLDRIGCYRTLEWPVLPELEGDDENYALIAPAATPRMGRAAHTKAVKVNCFTKTQNTNKFLRVISGKTAGNSKAIDGYNAVVDEDKAAIGDKMMLVDKDMDKIAAKAARKAPATKVADALEKMLEKQQRAKKNKKKKSAKCCKFSCLCCADKNDNSHDEMTDAEAEECDSGVGTASVNDTVDESASDSGPGAPQEHHSENVRDQGECTDLVNNLSYHIDLIVQNNVRAADAQSEMEKLHKEREEAMRDVEQSARTAGKGRKERHEGKKAALGEFSVQCNATNSLKQETEDEVVKTLMPGICFLNEKSAIDEHASFNKPRVVGATYSNKIIKHLPKQTPGGIFMTANFTEEMVVTNNGNDMTVEAAIAKVSRRAVDEMNEYLPNLRLDTKIVEITDDDFIAAPVRDRTTYDAYTFWKEMLPSTCSHDERGTLNAQTSVLVKPVFKTGKIDYQQLISPVNTRRHPINQTLKYYSLGKGNGNTFWAKNGFQELAVLAERYWGKQRQFVIDAEALNLLDEIVDSWFAKRVNYVDGLPVLPDQYQIQQVINEFNQACSERKYAQSYEGKDGDEDPMGRCIRFALKDIIMD